MGLILNHRELTHRGETVPVPAPLETTIFSFTDCCGPSLAITNLLFIFPLFLKHAAQFLDTSRELYCEQLLSVTAFQTAKHVLMRFWHGWDLLWDTDLLEAQNLLV